MKTGDNQPIDLTPFDDIEIISNRNCAVAVNSEIKSKQCNQDKNVVCQTPCTWLPTTTTSTIPPLTAITNPSPTEEVDIFTTTTASCQPSLSVESQINSKFYKAVESSNGFHGTPEACTASDMELANIQNDEDILALHETLGLQHKVIFQEF